VLGDAKRATIAALVARKAADAFAHIDAIEADDVVDLLAGAGGLAATTGVIIGRRAPEADGGLVRLGRVARKLLRRLESPVFVVPPDLEQAHIGAGPIVCAVNLDQHSVDAAEFAVRLGEAIGREVRLVHVIHSSDPIGIGYLPETTWNDIHRRQRDDAKVTLQRWRDDAKLPAYTLVSDGRTVPQLISAARELDACMILCGSRRLSAAERLWSSSVGSALAAASHLPVGVIPGS
jgi:nucleotide-binding universal stress UspA family protein